MNKSADKFNYIVIILAVSLIVSVFARFSDAPGIQSALFFILCVTFFFNFNAYSAGFKTAVMPLLFFILFAVFSYYGADFQYHARNGILLLSCCGAAYLLTGFMKPYDKRGVLIIPVLIGLWLTIFLLSANFTFSGYFAPEALSKSSRAFAGFLILAFSLSFVFWWTGRKIYVYTSFIILAAVVMTKSYYALALSSLLFAVFLYLMREKVKVKTRVAALALLFVSAAAFYGAFKSGYFASKIPVWRNACAVIKDNLFTGTGFANYSAVSGAYAEAAGIDVSGPDNIVLQLLAETGLIGFILFVLVLAVFFVHAAPKAFDKEKKTVYLPVLLGVIFFLAYNMFESTAFVSTNMLVFFILLAFPVETREIKNRTKKINAYIAVLLVLPLLYMLALPLLALEDYKKGIMLFAAGKYAPARDLYLDALEKDGLNPAYASKLSDTYFAMSRENGALNLEKAVEYKKLALSLHRHEGKYYYDLAWLYDKKGEKRLASDNIQKALEMDPFNRQFLDSYGELIY